MIYMYRTFKDKMLKLITQRIYNHKINFTGVTNKRTANARMCDDIYATYRNGHKLRDTFDKDSNSLDICSNGLYPANVLSNLARKPFVFDGVECTSVEGFLQSLKTDDPEEQVKICKLFGGSAKKTSAEHKDWIKSGKLFWKGKSYDRSSEEYKKLLLRAFSECYNQNDIFKTALEETKGQKLTHLTGKNNPSETVLTADEFTNILTALRDKNIN